MIDIPFYQVLASKLANALRRVVPQWGSGLLGPAPSGVQGGAPCREAGAPEKFEHTGLLDLLRATLVPKSYKNKTPNSFKNKI